MRRRQLSLGDSVADGLIAGVFAGGCWMLAQVAISVWFDGSPLAPLRLVSALVLGPVALSAAYPLVSVAVVGAAVHLAVSVLYGLGAFLLLHLTRRRSAHPARLILFGAAVGALAWAFDFLLVGGLFFPELLILDPLLNGLGVHVGVFGIVLGLYAILTRPRSRAV